MLPIIMISLALALRQMSMSIVGPFISTYCKSLTGYTPLLAGLAVGSFGLTQAIFQIPFGVCSDRYGNKRMMIIGLLLVIIGLITAFFAQSIFVLILARVLQGCGAVIGVGYAWVASMADDSIRTKALGMLGAIVSSAAALAFVVGPILRSFMTVNWMFMTGAILLSANVLYILLFLENAGGVAAAAWPRPSDILALLKDKTFVLMNIAAFLNNFMMMSVFFAAPIYFDQVVGQGSMWKIFTVAVAAGAFYMKAAIKCAGKGWINQVVVFSFALSSLSILCYFRPSSYLFLLTGTTLYMCGYIAVSTVVATNVNHIMQDHLRGTGNGIFNSFQYIGNFAGALVTGAVWGSSQTVAWLIVMAVGAVGLTMMALGRPATGQSLQREGIHAR